MGAVEPNEEEQKALAEQAAQPDPASVLADAQGKALEAAAVKDIELAKKAEADTGLSKAKTVETLTGIGQPANDAAAPRILRGNQLP
jgi:hypothetical protein